ncbi:hypothetical protein BCR33DRAFT_791457 [Rhizoclosmatium globosum]|uniref:PH domain-containing protein n=1 Tax=Rhizoclosmatium globosum TaxID=329046 RepID=A0A1Y2BFG0_9FUNG|nr:hypothetical protein BCR33DRAFT_791457 [Rhizoclosmatium globosum]|eukprot:ORY33227.1 hypothetical protein BCR33DRAFT_791457 [Rhizoclosmatium globosum]
MRGTTAKLEDLLASLASELEAVDQRHTIDSFGRLRASAVITGRLDYLSLAGWLPHLVVLSPNGTLSLFHITAQQFSKPAASISITHISSTSPATFDVLGSPTPSTSPTSDTITLRWGFRCPDYGTLDIWVKCVHRVLADPYPGLQPRRDPNHVSLDSEETVVQVEDPTSFVLDALSRDSMLQKARVNGSGSSGLDITLDKSGTGRRMSGYGVPLQRSRSVGVTVPPRRDELRKQAQPQPMPTVAVPRLARSTSYGHTIVAPTRISSPTGSEETLPGRSSPVELATDKNYNIPNRWELDATTLQNRKAWGNQAIKHRHIHPRTSSSAITVGSPGEKKKWAPFGQWFKKTK